MKYVIDEQRKNKFSGKTAMMNLMKKAKGTILLAGTALITTFGAFSVEAKAAVKPHYSEWTEHQVVAQLAEQNEEHIAALKEIEHDIDQIELFMDMLKQNPMVNRDAERLKCLQEKEMVVTEKLYETDSRLAQVNNRLEILDQAEKESETKQNQKQILEQRMEELEHQVTNGTATLESVQKVYQKATKDVSNQEFLNDLAEKIILAEKQINHEQQAKQDLERRVQAREEDEAIRQARKAEKNVLEKEKTELEKTIVQTKNNYQVIQELKADALQNISRVANNVVNNTTKENGKTK